MSDAANRTPLARSINRFSLSTAQPLLWFLLVFELPSLYAVWRLGGEWALVIYVVVAPLLFAFGWHFGPRLLNAVPDWSVWVLAVATFLALLALFALIYPQANAGAIGGGSDRDDALNIATRELLQGRYPYYARTYLDRPISPLPGSLLLSVPFVLLGNSSYQNFFWLALFFYFATRTANVRRALLLLWSILALAPVVLQQLLTGGDLATNSISLLLISVMLCQQRQSWWQRSIWAALLGLALSSRVNFWFLLPPLFAYVWQRQGRRAALLLLGLSTVTLLAITLPFYLYDPQGFSPLHTAQRLQRFGLVAPFTWLAPFGAGLLALLLAAQSAANRQALWRNVTLALAGPLLLALAAGLFPSVRVDLAIVVHGTGYLFFGAWLFLRQGMGDQTV